MPLAVDPIHLLTGGALGASVSGLVFWVFYRAALKPKLNSARARAEYLEKSARLLEASINQNIEAVLLWPSDSTEEVASAQLHELLNIPSQIRKVGLIDVLNLFEGSARGELDSYCRGLRSNGEPFRLNLSSNRLKKTFGIQGARLLSDKGLYLGDVLRIRDRTEELNEMGRLSQEVKTLGVEARRLRDVFDAIPVPIWLRTQDLAIAFCNKAYKNAVEGDPTLAAAASAKKFEIGAGALGSDGRSLAQKAVNNNRPMAERHHIVMGGNRRLVELHEIPITVGSTLASIAGCALDYSNLDETRRELDRQEKAQGDLLESIDSAIAIFGTDRRLRFFNTAFAELMKLEDTWLNTKPDLGELMESLRDRRLLPEVANFPEFKKSWMELFSTLLDSKDELMHLPDGRTWRMLTTPHPLGGLVFIFDDVSDRFKLEASHHMLSQVQRETIDNLYESIAVFGEDGRLKLYNPEFAKLWKLDEKKLQTEPHLTDITDWTKGFFDGEKRWTEYRQKLIQAHSTRAREAGRMDRSDKSILDYSIVPLPDGGSLFSYVDVTDSVQVENALRERTEALEAADQLKSEFVANVSYGLRAPLTSIIGFGEILNNNYFGKLNEKQKEYTKGILDASQKLLTLINDILDLATIEAGYMTLQYSNFDVHPMLASVMNYVRDRAAAQGLTIDFECPIDVGQISADERRLRQVLFNLLTNAMNFTPSGGKIELKGERKGKEVWITVSDNGAGIPPEDQGRVFEKFERGSAKKSGAGLGLSLVKSLVELHGGKVELQSAPNKGTTVICKLPVKQPKN